MKSKWSTKFPTKEGDYWFYGYRYGKISCGQKTKPEYMILKVRKCANAFIFIANSQFMYESEVEEAHFMPVDYPEKPELKP